MLKMPMSGLIRALLILGLVLLMAGICYLALMDRRRMVQRAERAAASLCAATGLSHMPQATTQLRYFRQYPSVGSPLRFAGGSMDGLHVEICYVPIIKRSSIGKTMLGILCAREFQVEVALSARDIASAVAYSLLGAANSIGTKPLFGNYDAWGPAADVARIFTSEFQARMLAFPRQFELVMVMNGREIVFVWKDIEADAGVVKGVLQLGSMLCELTGTSTR